MDSTPQHFSTWTQHAPFSNPSPYSHFHPDPLLTREQTRLEMNHCHRSRRTSRFNHISHRLYDRIGVAFNFLIVALVGPLNSLLSFDLTPSTFDKIPELICYASTLKLGTKFIPTQKLASIRVILADTNDQLRRLEWSTYFIRY